MLVDTKPRLSRQLGGMRGVYLVASELVRLGLIASPTSRSARGADILATTADLSQAFSVEVKSSMNKKFWYLAPHAKQLIAPSHFYVFVLIRQTKNGLEEISYFPVPSKIVAQKSRLPNPGKSEDDQYRPGYSIDLKEIEMFKDNWQIFDIK